MIITWLWKSKNTCIHSLSDLSHWFIRLTINGSRLYLDISQDVSVIPSIPQVFINKYTWNSTLRVQVRTFCLCPPIVVKHFFLKCRHWDWQLTLLKKSPQKQDCLKTSRVKHGLYCDQNFYNYLFYLFVGVCIYHLSDVSSACLLDKIKIINACLTLACIGINKLNNCNKF